MYIKWGTTNKEMYCIFKKSREDMNLDELASAWAWLQSNYGEIVDAN
jgi:hypothetical protein